MTRKGLVENLEMFRLGRQIGIETAPRYRYRVVAEAVKPQAQA